MYFKCANQVLKNDVIIKRTIDLNRNAKNK